MLLVQLTQSIVIETYSTIPQLQEENVIEYRHS